MNVELNDFDPVKLIEGDGWRLGVQRLPADGSRFFIESPDGETLFEAFAAAGGKVAQTNSPLFEQFIERIDEVDDHRKSDFTTTESLIKMIVALRRRVEKMESQSPVQVQIGPK